MSGIVGSIMMVVAILINSYGSSSLTGLFSIVLGFTISTTTLSYLFIFPAFIRLRYKYPNVARTYKVPGGLIGAWIVTIIPLAFAAVASYFILIPTDSTIASSNVSRFTYEVTEFSVLGAIVLLAIIFYVWGQFERSNKDVVVDLKIGSEVAFGDD
jgi:amino acid transporter